jgi:hypothetical protein
MSVVSTALAAAMRKVRTELVGRTSRLARQVQVGSGPTDGGFGDQPASTSNPYERPDRYRAPSRLVSNCSRAISANRLVVLGTRSGRNGHAHPSGVLQVARIAAMAIRLGTELRALHALERSLRCCRSWASRDCGYHSMKHRLCGTCPPPVQWFASVRRGLRQHVPFRLLQQYRWLVADHHAGAIAEA